MKKNLENFHEILTVSKHSHSEVGFILVISLWGSQKASGWGASAGNGGGEFMPPCVANIEFGKAVV